MNEKNLILANLPALLSAREVKSKTGQIPGEWGLHEGEINSFHGMTRNVEFTVIIQNASVLLKVSAKIHRETKKFSNIKVEEL